MVTEKNICATQFLFKLGKTAAVKMIDETYRNGSIGKIQVKEKGI